jgi:hypothetical protein
MFRGRDRNHGVAVFLDSSYNVYLEPRDHESLVEVASLKTMTSTILSLEAVPTDNEGL